MSVFDRWHAGTDEGTVADLLRSYSLSQLERMFADLVGFMEIVNEIIEEKAE